jgi:hypothetical protein
MNCANNNLECSPAQPLQYFGDLLSHKVWIIDLDKMATARRNRHAATSLFIGDICESLVILGPISVSNQQYVQVEEA